MVTSRHLFRNAPNAQVDTVWRVIADAVLNRVCENPIWISTAGGGVAWIHFRLDSYPKYYGYAEYRIV